MCQKEEDREVGECADERGGVCVLNEDMGKWDTKKPLPLSSGWKMVFHSFAEQWAGKVCRCVDGWACVFVSRSSGDTIIKCC